MTDTEKFDRLYDRVVRLERFVFKSGPRPSLADPLSSSDAEKADSIEREVCAAYGVSRQSLHGRSRLEKIVLARHVAFYVIYWRCKGATTERIAERFNRKCHGTVVRALQRVRDRMDTDKKVEAQVQKLMDWAAACGQQPPAPPTDNLPVASNGRKMIVQVGQPLVASNRRSEEQ